MWLAILGASLAIIVNLSGIPIGNTKYCKVEGFQQYGTLSNVTIGVFDTCVFVATTWRLLANAPPVGDTGGAGRFGLFGKYLPQFSRALLKDGQKYYIVAMVCNILVLIMADARSIPIVFQVFSRVPSAGLTNIVACRVFRNTKLGYYDEANATGMHSIMFRQSTHTTHIPVQSQHIQPIIRSISGTDLYTSNANDTGIPSSGISVEKVPQLSKEATVSAV